MSTFLQLKAEKASLFSVKDFFHGPVLSVLQQQEGMDMGEGTLVVKLRGDDERAWTIDFGEGALHEGAVDDPDCLLRTTEEAFRQLVLGKLDPAKAVQDKQLLCFGELALLERFASLLLAR